MKYKHFSLDEIWSDVISSTKRGYHPFIIVLRQLHTKHERVYMYYQGSDTFSIAGKKRMLLIDYLLMCLCRFRIGLSIGQLLVDKSVTWINFILFWVVYTYIWLSINTLKTLIPQCLDRLHKLHEECVWPSLTSQPSEILCTGKWGRG